MARTLNFADIFRGDAEELGPVFLSEGNHHRRPNPAISVAVVSI